MCDCADKGMSNAVRLSCAAARVEAAEGGQFNCMEIGLSRI
jgi:hypothetical protein